MVTRSRLWLKTTSEKGPHLSCVVFTEVLSGVRTLFSESIVFHLVFWASSFVVLVWVVLVFGFVLLRLWKIPGFLLFTCSRTM